MPTHPAARALVRLLGLGTLLVGGVAWAWRAPLPLDAARQPGVFFLLLLRLPGRPSPGASVLGTAEGAAALLSVIALAGAGVGLVLGAWARSVREYLVGQTYLQAQVLAMFAAFVTVWHHVGLALRG